MMIYLILTDNKEEFIRGTRVGKYMVNISNNRYYFDDIKEAKELNMNRVEIDKYKNNVETEEELLFSKYILYFAKDNKDYNILLETLKENDIYIYIQT